MFRTVSLSIIRSFPLHTQQWYMSYRFADSLRAGSLWHTPLLCVQWKTPDDGQRNCSKHVEFYSKNKFEKLVHLVGFIVRMSCRSHRSQYTILKYFEKRKIPTENFGIIITYKYGSKNSESQSVPLQAWSGPEGSRKLRFPDYVTVAQDGGKVVSFTYLPPLPPVYIPGTHFC